uniref:Ig-like domain-containing protein n=1 Tax=Seriola lalandi dorsalis TaxID=1841481 RepID=A0A3B4X112_SERLL
MWKRAKNSGPTVRQNFSLVHQYIQRFNEVSGNKSAVIRRISKTTGVMITQYVVNLPEGKTTPDFQCIPAPVSIQEGKLAVFKAVVKGDPKPEVSWRRAKGHTFDKDKFQSKYDESTGEHILEIRRVCADDTDTFKCYAVNEYGKAVCTTTLTVHDASTNPSDFRKLLRKSKVERADGETDERFWEAMLKADRKDYERICSEFGVDLHLILKKLDEKKKERMQNKCKDGVIPYHEDTTEKHSFKSVERMKDFSIKGQIQKDTELNQMDVERVHLLHTGLNETDDEEVNLLPTEIKLSNVDFVIKIQEIKAQEREDALFECVLTHPLPRITWMGKGSTLEDGEKYSITVSDHKLIHRLLIRNCKQLDKGIYSAVAGITSCSAWLVVEDEGDPTSAGKKKPRKTTSASGAQIELEKVAKQQQIKYREEMEMILAVVKTKHEAGELKGEKTLTTGGRAGEITAVTGLGENAGAVKDEPDASVLSKPTESKEKAKLKNSRGDGTVSKLDVSGCVTKTEVQVIADDSKNKKHTKSGQVDFDKVTGKVDLCLTMHFNHQHFSE